MERFVALLLLLGAAHQAAALYSSNGPVVELTPSNFESRIRGGGIWLVEVGKHAVNRSQLCQDHHNASAMSTPITHACWLRICNCKA
jgi:hypothetical protein